VETATLESGSREQIGAAIREAAAVLRRGGLVVFPTETVYGLGAAAGSAEAVAKLRGFKNDPERPFALHLDSPEAVWRFVQPTSVRVGRIIERLLGGPITLHLQLGEGLALEAGVLGADAERDALGLGRTLRLRCPGHPLARQLLGEVGVPVVAGSASRDHKPLPADGEQAAAVVAGVADYLLDGGPCKHGKPSTSVSLSIRRGSPVVQVLNEGVYDRRTVERLARFSILLVCTGNTCRSPMAEAIAKQRLADRLGIAVDELGAAGLSVVSAGAFASPGQEATPEAVEALRGRGIDLGKHRSQPLTAAMIDEADLILGMTSSHVRAVREMAPSAADRVVRLDEADDIADPIGQNLSAYQQTAEQIARALEHRLKEQL